VTCAEGGYPSGRPAATVAPVHARRLAVLFLLVASGCHRRAGSSSEAGPAADGSATPGPDAAVIAAPIAAARAPSGVVLAAGTVPSRGAVVVSRIGDASAKVWSVDALTGLSASTNVELRAFPSADGIILVYRGRREGRPVTEAVTVSAAGKVSATTVEASTAACATDDALTWIARAKGGASRVLTVPWSLSPVAELLTLPEERDPMLVCGSKTVFVLGDGEKDTTLAFLRSGPQPSSVVMRERDFADEEREHDSFVVGDSLGLVRIGQSGSVSIREVAVAVHDGGAGAWRHLTTKLTEADDVVAVDGDPRANLVVFTRDDSGSCDGPGAPSVHALYVTKESGAEQIVDLAPAACDRDPAQFWTGAIGGSFVAAWADRPSAPPVGDPKVTGLFYRTVGAKGLGELKHVPLTADEIVDADCDKNRCYAAVLARVAGGPDRIELLTYP
jgi:hypothetical protein